MSPNDERLIKEIEARKDDPVARKVARRLRTFLKLDTEASNYVESVICMRTRFTGDPPYVGWKGLGLALSQELDERDRLKKIHAECHRLLNEARIPGNQGTKNGLVGRIKAALSATERE